MDDESGESMEPMEEVPLIQLSEAELERLVRGFLYLFTLHRDSCLDLPRRRKNSHTQAEPLPTLSLARPSNSIYNASSMLLI